MAEYTTDFYEYAARVKKDIETFTRSLPISGLFELLDHFKDIEAETDELDDEAAEKIFRTGVTHLSLIALRRERDRRSEGTTE